MEEINDSCAADIKQKAAECGWCQFSCSTHDDLYKIARPFGKPMAYNTKGNFLANLRIRESSQCHPNSLSSRFGSKQFPFHTDGAHLAKPPTFIIIRSMTHDLSLTPTLLTHLNDYNYLQDICGNEQDLWAFRGGNLSYYFPILSTNKQSGTFSVRFNPAIMRSESSIQNPYTISEKLVSKSKIESLLWERGLAILVHNGHVLHARGPAQYPIHTTSRNLERLYLE